VISVPSVVNLLSLAGQHSAQMVRFKQAELGYHTDVCPLILTTPSYSGAMATR